MSDTVLILPHVLCHLVLPVTQHVSFATLQRKIWKLRIKIPMEITQLASSGAQGYSTLEPRFFLFLLDFSCWYDVYIKQIPEHALLFSTYRFSLESWSICMVSIVLLYTDGFNIYISVHTSLLLQIYIFNYLRDFSPWMSS